MLFRLLREKKKSHPPGGTRGTRVDELWKNAHRSMDKSGACMHARDWQPRPRAPGRGCHGWQNHLFSFLFFFDLGMQHIHSISLLPTCSHKHVRASPSLPRGTTLSFSLSRARALSLALFWCPHPQMRFDVLVGITATNGPALALPQLGITSWHTRSVVYVGGRAWYCPASQVVTSWQPFAPSHDPCANSNVPGSWHVVNGVQCPSTMRKHGGGWVAERGAGAR